MLTYAIHDFSVWLRTGSIPADIIGFRSHTGKKNISYAVTNGPYYSCNMQKLERFAREKKNEGRKIENLGMTTYHILRQVYRNGCKIYVDIMTGENLSSIDIIYWSVCSFRRGCGMGWISGNSYFSQLRV